MRRRGWRYEGARCGDIERGLRGSADLGKDALE